MHLLFEESGKILTGRVLSQSDVSTQVEQDSGKRVKVKAVNILLKVDLSDPASWMAEATELSHGIELDIAWEFAPDDEFGFADLAREYFSAHATPLEQAAMMLALYNAPHYFRRAGKGRFRKAAADIVAQAIVAIEKKKQTTLQIQEWVTSLSEGQCPPPIRDQLYKILFKPDKNAPEYKAVVGASRATHLGPLDVLIKAGAIDSPYQFHWRRFLLENFPKGTGFTTHDVPFITDELPLSAARAFSIDDSSTTEIDDALSVQGLGTGKVLMGIHIAAPGLAILPGSALDQLCRTRLSTVYMPGHKITMLPDEVVQNYTLMEGQDCPAVSLYLTLDEATLDITATQTQLERVHIESNLRHEQLDAVVTKDWLERPDFIHEIDPQPLLHKRRQLSFLYRLAQHLKTQREIIRGKPENFSRPEYTYQLLGHANAAAKEWEDNQPDGTETVHIGERVRSTPLNLIVSEAMILANSTWGGWLAELGVPAIYRSQTSMAPGVKVRMGTKALIHAGMGVKSYAWSSSPLRRYTDLVNQWQIIACARYGKTAALAAPFKPKDADLYAIISSFESTYSSYKDFQNALERFWVLKYVQQQGIVEVEATLFKDNLVRADHLPLVMLVAGAQNLPRWSRVMVRLGDIDLVSLNVYGTVTARIDATEDASASDDEQEDDTLAGPIAICVDVSDTEPASPPTGDFSAS